MTIFRHGKSTSKSCQIGPVHGIDTSRMLSSVGEFVLYTLYQMNKEVQEKHHSTELFVFPVSMIVKRADKYLTFIDERAREECVQASLRSELKNSRFSEFIPLPLRLTPWGELEYGYDSGAARLTPRGIRAAESERMSTIAKWAEERAKEHNHTGVVTPQQEVPA